MGLGDEGREAEGSHGEGVHRIWMGGNLLVDPQTVALRGSGGGREGVGKGSDLEGLKRERKYHINVGRVLTQDVRKMLHVGRVSHDCYHCLHS